MKKSDITREKLLNAATSAFCERSYTHVPLREIAAQAQVDVALISRYFGNKRGLFNAVLDHTLDWPELVASSDPIGVAIAKYTGPNASDAHMGVVRLIVLNGADPDVGDLLRERLHDRLIIPMLERMGGSENAPRLALFIAVTLGAAMVRHTLKLPSMADATAQEYGQQLRHIMEAALSYSSAPDTASQVVNEKAAPKGG